jgi:hypothetical protein
VITTVLLLEGIKATMLYRNERKKKTEKFLEALCAIYLGETELPCACARHNNERNLEVCAAKRA